MFLLIIHIKKEPESEKGGLGGPLGETSIRAGSLVTPHRDLGHQGGGGRAGLWGAQTETDSRLESMGRPSQQPALCLAFPREY